jgi:predicted membrane chloride channel (bestrophin family)
VLNTKPVEAEVAQALQEGLAKILELKHKLNEDPEKERLKTLLAESREEGQKLRNQRNDVLQAYADLVARQKEVSDLASSKLTQFEAFRQNGH